MKLTLSLFILVSLSLFSCTSGKSTVNNSLIGKWEGTDERGKTRALLTINPSDLEYVEDGRSSKRSYSLSDEDKTVKIEGYDERFVPYFVDDKTMRLGLSDVDARKAHAPLISILTFHRQE